MDMSNTITKPLKKLFSPSALAATVVTGMLIQVAVASGGGGQSCLSQCAVFTQPSDCYPNLECNVSGTTYYWCCPIGDSCGQDYVDYTCKYYYGGWCVCPGSPSK